MFAVHGYKPVFLEQECVVCAGSENLLAHVDLASNALDPPGEKHPICKKCIRRWTITKLQSGLFPSCPSCRVRFHPLSVLSFGEIKQLNTRLRKKQIKEIQMAVTALSVGIINGATGGVFKGLVAGGIGGMMLSVFPSTFEINRTYEIGVVSVVSMIFGCIGVASKENVSQAIGAIGAISLIRRFGDLENGKVVSMIGAIAGGIIGRGLNRGVRWLGIQASDALLPCLIVFGLPIVAAAISTVAIYSHRRIVESEEMVVSSLLDIEELASYSAALPLSRKEVGEIVQFSSAIITCVLTAIVVGKEGNAAGISAGAALGLSLGAVGHSIGQVIISRLYRRGESPS